MMIPRPVGWVSLLLALTVPVSAGASCRTINRCGCDQVQVWAAVLRWDAAGDGGSVAVIQTLSTASARDAGPDLALWNSFADAGAQVLLTETGDQLPVGADGLLHCESATFAASTWPAALTDRSCVQRLSDAGVVQPPCNDTGRRGFGCSATGAFFPGLALALVALTRRRR